VVHYNQNLTQDKGQWPRASIQVDQPEWRGAQEPSNSVHHRFVVPDKIIEESGNETVAEEMSIIRKVNMLHACSEQMCYPSSYLDLDKLLTQSQYQTLPASADDCLKLRHEKQLQTVLHNFSLHTVEIPKDGNCLFTAIIVQLSQCTEKMSDAYLTFLGNIKLIGDELVAQRAQTLREEVMNNISQNEQLYLPFLENCSRDTFTAYIQQYSKSGEFSGSFGDLLPIACSDYLHTVIVLLSSDAKMQVLTIIPQSDVLNECPLYLAYTAMGCGHYDATMPVSKSDCLPVIESSSKHTTEKSNYSKCRCGINNKKDGGSSKQFCRTSRCPCFNSNFACKIECTCYNCKNGKMLGLKPLATRKVTFKKKHFKHASKLKRCRAADSLDCKGIEIVGKAWTLKESLLFHQIILRQPTLKKCPRKLSLLFNNLSNKMDSIRKKNKQQVEKKLSSYKK
jgi:hypothetical protein